MIGLRHTLLARLMRRGPNRVSWQGIRTGTATIVTFAYLSVALLCACTDGLRLRLPGSEAIAFSNVASESSIPDSDEELCAFMHEQMVTQQVASIGSIGPAKLAFAGTLGGLEVPHQPAIVEVFRPPRVPALTANGSSFELSAVLRI